MLWVYTDSCSKAGLNNAQRSTMSWVDCTSSKEWIQKNKKRLTFWRTTKKMPLKSSIAHWRSSHTSQTLIWQKQKQTFWTPLAQPILGLNLIKPGNTSLMHYLTHNYLISPPFHALKPTWILPSSITALIGEKTTRKPIKLSPNTLAWSNWMLTTDKRRTECCANGNMHVWARSDIKKVSR